MRRSLGGLAAALVVFGASSAAAQEFSTEKQYSHDGQFGIHVHSGTGYRAIFTYDDEFCGQLTSDGTDNRDACTGRSPVFLDAGLSYGVTGRVELFLEMRFGLESDFGFTPGDAGPSALSFAPGIKYYVRDAGLTKWFSSVSLMIDTADFEQAPETDLAVRSNNGLQFDLHKTVGVYFFFGVTTGWTRWLRFEMDGGLGIQARFP